MAMSRDKLKSIFDELGVGQDGFISFQEFPKLCDHFGIDPMDEKELNQLFNNLDTNHDGKLSHEEFFVGVIRKDSPNERNLKSQSAEEEKLPVSSANPALPATTPASDTKVTPATDTEVTPATDTKVTPTTDTKVTLATDTEVTPATDTEVTPATDTKVAPATDTEVTPATDTKVTPATDTKVTPATDTKVTPENPDAGRTPSLMTDLFSDLKERNQNYATRPDASDWLNYLDSDGTGYVNGTEVIDLFERVGLPNAKQTLEQLKFSPNGKIQCSDLSHALEQELYKPQNVTLHEAAIVTLLYSTDKFWNDNFDLVEECERLKDELNKNIKDAEENLDALERRKNMELKLLQEANQKLREDTTKNVAAPPSTLLSNSSPTSQEGVDELKKLQEELEKQLEKSMEDCKNLKQRNYALESEIQTLKEDLDETSNKADYLLKENDRLLGDLKNSKQLEDSAKKDGVEQNGPTRSQSFDIDDNMTPEEVRARVREEMERLQRRASKERKEVEGTLLVEISELERKHEEDLEKLKNDHENEKADLIATHNREIADTIAEKEKDLMTEFILAKVKSENTEGPADDFKEKMLNLENEIQQKDEEIKKQNEDIAEKTKIIQESSLKKHILTRDVSCDTDDFDLPEEDRPVPSTRITLDKELPIKDEKDTEVSAKKDALSDPKKDEKDDLGEKVAEVGVKKKVPNDQSDKVDELNSKLNELERKNTEQEGLHKDEIKKREQEFLKRSDDSAAGHKEELDKLVDAHRMELQDMKEKHDKEISNSKKSHEDEIRNFQEELELSTNSNDHRLTDANKKLADMNEELLELDRTVETQEEMLKECSDKIAGLQSVVSKKDEEIMNKDKEIKNKDNEIENKNEEIMNKDEEIKNKDEEIKNKDKEIKNKDEEIKNKEIKIKDLKISDLQQTPEMMKVPPDSKPVESKDVPRIDDKTDKLVKLRGDYKSEIAKMKKDHEAELESIKIQLQDALKSNENKSEPKIDPKNADDIDNKTQGKLSGIIQNYENQIAKAGSQEKKIVRRESKFEPLLTTKSELPKEKPGNSESETGRKLSDVIQDYESKIDDLKKQFEMDRDELIKKHKAEIDFVKNDPAEPQARTKSKVEIPAEKREVAESRDGKGLSEVVEQYESRINDIKRQAEKEKEELEKKYKGDVEALRNKIESESEVIPNDSKPTPTLENKRDIESETGKKLSKVIEDYENKIADLKNKAEKEKNDLKEFYKEEMEKVSGDFEVTLARLNQDREEKLAKAKEFGNSLYDDKIKDIVNVYEEKILNLKLENDRKISDLNKRLEKKGVDEDEKYEDLIGDIKKRKDGEIELLNNTIKNLKRDLANQQENKSLFPEKDKNIELLLKNQIDNLFKEKNQLQTDMASARKEGEKKGRNYEKLIRHFLISSAALRNEFPEQESLQVTPKRGQMNNADLNAEKDLLRDQLKRTLDQLKEVTSTLTAVTAQHRADKQALGAAKEKLIDPIKHQELTNKLAWLEATNEKLQAILERNQSDATKMLIATREIYDKEMKEITKEKKMNEVQSMKFRKLLHEKDEKLKEVDEKQSKADRLVKDLYTENARLIKYLQHLEKLNIDTNSKVQNLEEKCLVLGDLVRKLCPAALS